MTKNEIPRGRLYRLPEAVAILPGPNCEINDCQLPACAEAVASPDAEGLGRIVLYDVQVDLRVVEPADSVNTQPTPATIN